MMRITVAQTRTVKISIQSLETCTLPMGSMVGPRCCPARAGCPLRRPRPATRRRERAAAAAGDSL